MGSAIDVSQQEARIAERVNPDITKALTISRDAGGVRFVNAEQVTEFAKFLAISKGGVRKHLRGDVGACLAIVVQSIEWGLSPFAVANKSYFVNDQIAYESQLVQAVILRRAPILGRIKFRFEGKGDNRVCIASATLKDGTGDVEYESPLFSKISPKNSPLWKTDPDQQHCYYSGRALCRRHFPDVLLGIYAEDEFDRGQPSIDAPTFAKDVTPARSIVSKLDDLAGTSTREHSASAAEEEETVEHDRETGEVFGEAPGDDDAIDQHGDGGSLQLTPREQLIHELRGKMMNGVGALKLLNELPPDQIAFLTPQDKDDLKAAWRQMQPDKGARRPEHVDG